ncbi:hypothetical protein L6452_35007 [Arctium lappa]|uniref:Uncharacterized protein n=1 Tax=Arctium lappa TaxID=4217 RepID=A0ACB8YLA6_ARCLA|nr:hypothetical protein L6452_35007 [Arctium lappa]
MRVYEERTIEICGSSEERTIEICGSSEERTIEICGSSEECTLRYAGAEKYALRVLWDAHSRTLRAVLPLIAIFSLDDLESNETVS